MPIDEAAIKFTKKILPFETRQSKLRVDATMKELREAVVTASRVSAFYNDYIADAKAAGRAVNIMPRDAVQILGQMKNQKLYVCEKLENPDPTIVAASILWDDELPVPTPGRGHNGYSAKRFLEIGTQVSRLPGFGFQWVLTSFTLVEQLLVDPTGIMFAATYGDSKAAENFKGTMKFCAWRDVPPTLESLRLHHLEVEGQLHRGVKWFRPTAATLIAAAQLIIDLYENPVRKVKDTQRASGYPIKQIQFHVEAQFKVAGFDDILRYCRRLSERKPTTLAQLQEAIENPQIDEEFICWACEG